MKDKFNKINEDAKLVGASCVVVKDGKIVESLNYGYSSLENKTFVNDRTVFRIASISKIIVALSVFKLYEKGLVDIDSDISKYLGFNLRNPYHPNSVITIKMLMTQTSSLTDGAEDDKNGFYTGYNKVNGTNVECKLIDLLNKDGKYYTLDTFNKELPGTKFIYSNFNCGILACIVEEVSRVKFTSFVRQNILLPLGLDASFNANDIITSDIATLYLPDKDWVKISRTREKFIELVYPDFGLAENFRGPAGGLFISMQDLSRIMNMLMNNGYPLFKKETIDLMLSSHWKGQGDSTYKEKGLQVQINDYFNNRRLKGHFGDAYGVKSFMLFNEEKKIGICYITNGGHYKYQENGYSDIHEKMINVFLDKYWF